MRKALQTFKDNHRGKDETSLMQGFIPRAQHLAVLAKSVITAMSKHQDILTGVFTKSESTAVAALIQSAAQPSSDGSYAPAS